MHSVCDCQQHQNAKLLVSVKPGIKDYRDLMAKMVCNLENRYCVMLSCENCPGKAALHDHLLQFFAEHEIDMDDTVGTIGLDQVATPDSTPVSSVTGESEPRFSSPNFHRFGWCPQRIQVGRGVNSGQGKIEPSTTHEATPGREATLGLEATPGHEFVSPSPPQVRREVLDLANLFDEEPNTSVKVPLPVGVSKSSSETSSPSVSDRFRQSLTSSSSTPSLSTGSLYSPSEQEIGFRKHE
ncbi:hypothetical protein HOLleu_01089 [Holothuria leucospilota]|uniref:Uncharacterized protein n=1 Tax=Holothuria leucospilota TaxID=206669 RepID=A0A9Q1CPH9_HOLLE|nr:hypothetical protein HOLleu_01089 [Holothuria leucospilota]